MSFADDSTPPDIIPTESVDASQFLFLFMLGLDLSFIIVVVVLKSFYSDTTVRSGSSTIDKRKRKKRAAKNCDDNYKLHLKIDSATEDLYNTYVRSVFIKPTEQQQS